MTCLNPILIKFKLLSDQPAVTYETRRIATHSLPENMLLTALNEWDSLCAGSFAGFYMFNYRYLFSRRFFPCD